MELMDGGSLHKFIQSVNLVNAEWPWKHRLQIAFEVVCGMRALTDRGIVHRDLKSKNILLSKLGSQQDCRCPQPSGAALLRATTVACHRTHTAPDLMGLMPAALHAAAWCCAGRPAARLTVY